MKHFLSIQDLPVSTVDHLLERALHFKYNPDFPSYSSINLANLFYENSTRTRISFELAAKALAMKVVNVDIANSSESKGETIEDTLRTLAAMGIDLFVIRHSQEGLPAQLAPILKQQGHIINAGDGCHAHPSQAMLDLMTIREKKPRLDTLKIAIVGDLLHSRVANSLQCLFKKVGVQSLFLVAPDVWQPQTIHFGQVTASLEEGLAHADVVIALRVQKERIAQEESLDLATYCRDYAITETHLRWAKKDVIVMHPGPINRGIEIENAVADGSHSLILTQVQNGVYMRMAILEWLSSS
mgnify:CR=1 FL=1